MYFVSELLCAYLFLSPTVSFGLWWCMVCNKRYAPPQISPDKFFFLSLQVVLITLSATFIRLTDLEIQTVRSPKHNFSVAEICSCLIRAHQISEEVSSSVFIHFELEYLVCHISRLMFSQAFRNTNQRLSFESTADLSSLLSSSSEVLNGSTAEGSGAQMIKGQFYKRETSKICQVFE